MNAFSDDRMLNRPSGHIPATVGYETHTPHTTPTLSIDRQASHDRIFNQIDPKVAVIARKGPLDRSPCVRSCRPPAIAACDGSSAPAESSERAEQAKWPMGSVLAQAA